MNIDLYFKLQSLFIEIIDTPIRLIEDWMEYIRLLYE